MPAKHQPDLLLLRHVPLSRVHLFTAIQLACLGLLWIIKSTPAAIIFPIMVTQGWVASWGVPERLWAWEGGQGFHERKTLPSFLFPWLCLVGNPRTNKDGQGMPADGPWDT